MPREVYRGQRTNFSFAGNNNNNDLTRSQANFLRSQTLLPEEAMKRDIRE